MEALLMTIMALFVCLVASLVRSHLQTKTITDLIEQLHSARKDTGHWYARCNELEIQAACRKGANFEGLGKLPKDYEEQQI